MDSKQIKKQIKSAINRFTAIDNYVMKSNDTLNVLICDDILDLISIIMDIEGMLDISIADSKLQYIYDKRLEISISQFIDLIAELKN